MISRSRLLLLFVVAVVVVGLAFLMSSLRDTSPEEAVGSKVLPNLAKEINDVEEVRIFTAGDRARVHLKRNQDKSWQVVERNGYPADFGKLRELLLKLAEMEILEIKTSVPESYSQIGVEDIKSDNASGKRIELVGLKAPAKLIVGKSAPPAGNYVRVDGQPTSYLAKPQITVDEEPKAWLERDLFDIPTERVQEVRVALADGKVNERKYTVTRAVREQTDFAVPNLPKGRKLSYSGAANANAGALASFAFEDVHAAKAEENWEKGVSRAEYRLFDGTVITLLGRKDKSKPAEGGAEADQYLMKLRASFDDAQHKRFLLKPAEPTAADKKSPDAAADSNAATGPQVAPGPTKPNAPDTAEIREKVKQLNEQFQNWVFEMSSYKYDAVFRPLDELLEKT